MEYSREKYRISYPDSDDDWKWLEIITLISSTIMRFDTLVTVMCLIGFIAGPHVEVFLFFCSSNAFPSIYRFVATHLVGVFFAFHRVMPFFSCWILFRFNTLMRNRQWGKRKRHLVLFFGSISFPSRSIIWMRFLCVFRECKKKKRQESFAFFRI